MPQPDEFILGEFRRSIDERHRVSIPTELAEALVSGGGDCILAKERPGCLSVWNEKQWGQHFESGVKLVRDKIAAGRLSGRLNDVQRLGRLLSTRHKTVTIAGRGRLLIPDGFREFLAVEPGGEVLIVGAALCLEIWNPTNWIELLRGQMPEFQALLDGLAD